MECLTTQFSSARVKSFTHCPSSFICIWDAAHWNCCANHSLICYLWRGYHRAIFTLACKIHCKTVLNTLMPRHWNHKVGIINFQYFITSGPFISEMQDFRHLFTQEIIVARLNLSNFHHFCMFNKDETACKYASTYCKSSSEFKLASPTNAPLWFLWP